MEVTRRPFQGIFNIIRFNWHFYVFALGICLLALGFTNFSVDSSKWFTYAIWILVIIPVTVSLLVSYYVYDRSNLYELKWLDDYSKTGKASILNVNAGFDETSKIIGQKFERPDLHICDFYDPKVHTEVSIARARNAYPPHPATIKISTQSLPFSDNTFDIVCVIFAAHEIRNEEERMKFFQELCRVTKPTGKIFITEHLRDASNFFAYTIGFLHFLSRHTWTKTFQTADLELMQEIKTTSFVHTFVLQQNGATS